MSVVEHIRFLSKSCYIHYRSFWPRSLCKPFVLFFLCLFVCFFSVKLPSDWTRKSSLTHKVVLTLWHQCLSLAWLIPIVAHGIQIWVCSLIILPPIRVCIAIFNTMNATTRESKIFIDSVSGLIWVFFSQENLLSDSTILTPLNFPLSLKCVLIDNTVLS